MTRRCARTISAGDFAAPGVGRAVASGIHTVFWLLTVQSPGYRANHGTPDARSSVETEPVTSAVDHADIRGLVTTLLESGRCLPRSRHEGLSQPQNVHEGCPSPGLRLRRESTSLPCQLSRGRGDTAIVPTLPPWPAPSQSPTCTPPARAHTRRGNRVRVPAPQGQLPVPPAQAHLRPEPFVAGSGQPGRTSGLEWPW